MDFIELAILSSELTQKRIDAIKNAYMIADKAFVEYRKRCTSNNWKKRHGIPMTRKHK